MVALDVSLRVGGRQYRGWSSVGVRASIKEAVRTFSFTAADQNDLDIDLQSKCEVFVGGALLCTGFLESRNINLKKSGVETTYRGVSSTVDFVDCSPDIVNSFLKNKNVLQSAQAMAAPFGIEVVAADPGRVVSYAAVNQGEKCFDYLNRITREQGFIITTDAVGRLVLAKSSASKMRGALKEGAGDTFGWSSSMDYGDRFSEYRVRGQTDDGAAVSGVYLDKKIKRYRPVVYRAKGQRLDASKNAEVIARRKIGESLKASVEVASWFTTEGEIFEPNKLIYVYAPSIKLDQLLLIETVDYNYNTNSFGCVLQLVDPVVYFGDKTPVNNSALEDWLDL